MGPLDRLIKEIFGDGKRREEVPRRVLLPHPSLKYTLKLHAIALRGSQMAPGSEIPTDVWYEMRNVKNALAQAPGLNVAQHNYYDWALMQPGRLLATLEDIIIPAWIEVLELDGQETAKIAVSKLFIAMYQRYEVY